METLTHHHHHHTGRQGCKPCCRKRHVRVEGSGNIMPATACSSSSLFKAAGRALLIFSAVSHSAAANDAAAGSVMFPSVFSSVLGQQVDYIETSFSSTANNRLLQDDHDHDAEHEEDEHLDEHVEDENHQDEFEHDHDEDGHSHNEGEEEDHDEHDEHEEEFHNTSTNANESKANGEPWGAVVGATLLVNIATFSGVLLLALPAMYRGFLKYRNIPGELSPAAHGSGKFFDIVIPGFAVGALVATSVFLVLPESLKYITGESSASHSDHSDHNRRYLQQDDHAGEGSIAAKFGCSVLGGFLLPFVLAIIFHHSDPSENEDLQTRTDNAAVIDEEEDCETCNDKPEMDVETTVKIGDPQDSTSSLMIQKIDDATPQEVCKCDVCEEGVNNETEQETIVTKSFVNKRLCASILLGDCFHNFADGFFIAAAFRACSVGVAVSIMFVTFFHEVAQELADFIVLTKYGGLSVWKALILNFISGLSVCLGGVIFLAASPSDVATGVILAMAGGVYINIAACETAPRMEKAMQVRSDRVLLLFSIIVGTLPIGLILLDHKHCD